MIKFIHKKHINKDVERGKITIYYSGSDIFLSVVLFVLVVFFINNYLSNALKKQQNNCLSYPEPISGLQKNIIKN